MSGTKHDAFDDEGVTHEECQQLSRIMSIKYAASLKGRFFELSVESGADTIQVKTVLANSDRSFYYPVEGRIEHREQNLGCREAALLVVDYIDTYFEEFLREDEGVFLPLDWRPYHFEDFEFQLRGQILNLKSEEEADDWLVRRGEGSLH